ncbi:MAG: hypothetical protein IT436_11185 [Phycisphaerales bacterium]|nr:hypothetical protein [Phycisphaerales bacterium]
MKKRIWLTVFLVTPAILVALLLYAIAALSKKPLMNEPPVGAGAGETGGANAIGNVIAGHKADYTRADEAAEQAAAQPRMVQPESLEQGFILIVQDKSGRAKAESPIYLAGTVNNWNPADPAFKLTPQSDMRWRIEVPRPAAAPMEFKFTRGSWTLEELNADLSAPANRKLAPIDISKLTAGEKPRIELVVERWGDERPDFKPEGAAATAPMKVMGELRKLPVQGGAGGTAGQTRDLLVWLPPGYDDPRNAARTYPVLYLHDGQNLFDKPATAPGEWGVDETATELIGKGEMQPIIIVGIPHSGEGRIREYMPVAALDNVKPEGEEHIAWLLHEVMPRVERAFRVKTGPESTGIGGSSLGAAIALDAATRYPDRFGLLLAESLPLRTGKSEAWDAWTDNMTAWPRRVYLGVGGQETGPEADKTARNQAYADATRALDKKMASAGLGADRRLLIVDAQATHTESAWAKRLPQALRFLYPPMVDGTK